MVRIAYEMTEASMVLVIKRLRVVFAHVSRLT